ncbi:MAG: hypothetical protein ACI976_000405 [Aureispira sp.]|jgi:hypothetical protein
MLRALAILWILLISVQSFYQGLIYTYYVLNKDYIVAELCENRAKPALQCEGKCHLKKVLQISKERSTPEQQPFLPSLEEIKSPVLFYEQVAVHFLDTAVHSLDNLQEDILFEYAFNYQYTPVFTSFQPPRA